MTEKILLLHCPGDKIYLHDYYTSYSSKANYYWQPTDLVILSGVLRAFDLHVIDAIADRIDSETCLRKIREFGPDAVIFTTGTATWDNDIKFVGELRKVFGGLIIGSSSIFLFEAEAFLNRAPAVDAVITDIITSPEIGEFIKGRVKEPRALAVRENGKVRLPQPGGREQNFYIPAPRHDLFNLKANRSPLAKRIPFALVVTSIGCPFTCKFCVAGSVAYRARAVDSVIEELRELKALGVREIMFNDPTFTVSQKRILELARKMEENGFSFTWVCNGHSSTITDEMASAMKRAGCHTVMIGVESVNDQTLAGAAKGSSREIIKRAFAICKKHGIKTLAYFIIGLPGEKKEDVLRTIRFAREIDCDYASFTVLTPDIGSKFRQEAVETGRLDSGMLIFDSSGYPVYTAGDLSIEEVWELRQKAVRTFYLRPAYLLKKILGIRSLRDFVLLVDQARAMFLK